MKNNKKLIAIIAVVVLVVVVAIFAVVKCKKGEIGHTVGMDDELEINVDNQKALIKVESIDTDIKVSEPFNTNNVHTFVGIKLSVTNKSDELLKIGYGYCGETLLDSNNNELGTSSIEMEDLYLSMDSEKKDTFIKSEIEAGQTEVGYIYFETDSKDIKKLKISFKTKDKTNHKETLEIGQKTYYFYYVDYYINLNMAKANSATNTNSISNDSSNTSENEEQTLWGNVSSTNTTNSTNTNNSTNTSSSSSANNSTNTSSSTNTNNSTNISNSTSSNDSTNQSSSNTVSETQNVGSLEFKLPSNQYTLRNEVDHENLKEKQFKRNDYKASIGVRRTTNPYSSIISYITNVYDGITEDKIKEATINGSTWYYISYKDKYGFSCECISQKDDYIYIVSVFGNDETTVKQEANKMPSYFKFN